MINVLCYMQPHRGGGVGRHGVEIVRRLLRRPDVAGKISASRWQLRRHPRFLAEMADLAVERHWLPQATAERMWKAMSWPPFPGRLKGYDCIYCPAEVRFPRMQLPKIFTVHDAQAFETNLPWSNTTEHRVFAAKWRTWLPTACREAARIATVSEFSRRRLSECLQIDPARFVVIGNGVSEVFFRAEPAVAEHRTNRVIVVGGLRTKKGAAATLAVAERLHRLGSPIVFDIYGQHDPQWITRAASHGNVKLHAYAEDSVVAAAMASAVAVLFLSLYEGFGIPAIEAMAAGTPAVVANTSSLPEVVGDAGIVVDHEDALRVAEILESLRTDAAMHGRLVEKGRARARHYTWDACVDRLVEAIEEVCP